MNNKYDFKNLTPFKWCVIQNFPFIEEDFDAITNYQLLCKVVEYLNNTIASTNELGEEVETISTNFIELKNYVDNYFNNLNVQDEVNNKLDEMVQDGTLNQIINQQIFGEINQKIENLENEIPNLEEKLTEMVVFGDSWSDPESPEAVWVNQVANILNLNVHNYAKSGATIVNPTYFRTEYNVFLNDNSFDKNKIKYFIIFGGINDYKNNHQINDVAAEINNLNLLLQQINNKAKILYISNCEFPYSRNQSMYWYTIQRRLVTGTRFSSFSLDCLVNFSEFAGTNDYYHYSEDGQSYISANIIASLTGGNIVKNPVLLDYTDNNGNEIRFSINRNDYMIQVSVDFWCNQDNINNLRFTIPESYKGIPFVEDIKGLFTSDSNKFIYCLMSGNLIDILSTENFRKMRYHFSTNILIDSK